MKLNGSSFSKNLGLATAVLLTSTASFAADIFVRNAEGSGLSRERIQQTTDMVRRAVESMPEHKLVLSEQRADFVLHPKVISRQDDSILRVEKYKDGELMAAAEHSVPTQGQDVESRNSALAVTEEALLRDSIAEGTDIPASEAGEDSTAMNQAGDRAIASSPTIDEGYGTFGGDQSVYNDQAVSNNSVSGSTSDSGISNGGVSRGISPRNQIMDRQTYYSAAVGPAFGLGMESDNVMYNITGAYNYNISDRLTAKGIGDLSLGAGDNSARFFNLAIGADVYPEFLTMGTAKPYVSADLGYGFVRNDEDQTENAPTLGLGAGFKFNARNLAWDVNLHYSYLTSQIDGGNPSVLALRGGVNF